MLGRPHVEQAWGNGNYVPHMREMPVKALYVENLPDTPHEDGTQRRPVEVPDQRVRGDVRHGGGKETAPTGGA